LITSLPLRELLWQRDFLVPGAGREWRATMRRVPPFIGHLPAPKKREGGHHVAERKASSCLPPFFPKNHAHHPSSPLLPQKNLPLSRYMTKYKKMELATFVCPWPPCVTSKKSTSSSYSSSVGTRKYQVNSLLRKRVSKSENREGYEPYEATFLRSWLCESPFYYCRTHDRQSFFLHIELPDETRCQFFHMIHISVSYSIIFFSITI